MGLMSGLNVGGSHQQGRPSSATVPGEGSQYKHPVTVAPIPVPASGLTLGLNEGGDATSTYPSPSSTVSPGGSGNGSASSSSLSLSSELIHALQGKPELVSDSRPEAW